MATAGPFGQRRDTTTLLAAFAVTASLLAARHVTAGAWSPSTPSARTGDGWREVRIASTPSLEESLPSPRSACHCVLPLEDSLRTGESVLVVPGVATAAECEAIAAPCVQAAELHRRSSGLDGGGLVRMPTIAAAARAAAARSPCAEPLDATVDSDCREILLRVLSFVDEQFPALSSSLFGAGGDADLRGMFLAKDRLNFSSREPAVNVYFEGGSFRPHEDGQSLTILVNLSSPDDHYVGGGTAFWSHESRGPRVVVPTLTLRPKAGTALLFGGDVTHAGVAVEAGHRVVFVASLSPRGRNRRV